MVKISTVYSLPAQHSHLGRHGTVDTADRVIDSARWVLSCGETNTLTAMCHECLTRYTLVTSCLLCSNRGSDVFLFSLSHKQLLLAAGCSHLQPALLHVQAVV